MSDTPPKKRGPVTGADLRGASQLVVDAVTGVTDVVEGMHRNIAGLSPIVGEGPKGRTRGITGLVYRSVRGVTRAVGVALDTVLKPLAPLLGSEQPSPRREAVLSAVNGVFGDYLEASGNPLAITMALRQQGEPLVLDKAALAAAFNPAKGRLLALVHGLCMNDLQWQREGHDHGAALARDLGFTPLYLHYNSGRAIVDNGRDFSALLDQLVQTWPVPVSDLVIVGHSMGGLVARSACHHAAQTGQAWPHCLTKMVFLGTPHQGAPLERAGTWLDLLLGVSPYTAPLAKLGLARSAGIKDLRHGRIAAEELGAKRGRKAGPMVPLPTGVACYAVAATKQAADAPGGAQSGPRARRLAGDGLVPVASALGQHREAALALAIPASHQAIVHGVDHFQLLSSGEVHEQLSAWLG